jgi:hypothetical protein
VAAVVVVVVVSVVWVGLCSLKHGREQLGRLATGCIVGGLDGRFFLLW